LLLTEGLMTISPTPAQLHWLCDRPATRNSRGRLNSALAA
jgi:hypothetical protein